uniref:Uncharacterized protein n=1 Tax=Arion vulgaris TaxID=1028688 RepID=A0A0B7AV31_9EUPU
MPLFSQLKNKPDQRLKVCVETGLVKIKQLPMEQDCSRSAGPCMNPAEGNLH